MTITPQDIQNREFREQFRGYHEDDVDSFLDEVAEEYGRLYVEAQRLRLQLSQTGQGGPPAAVAPPPPASSLGAEEPPAVTPAPAPQRPDERAGAREEMKRALVATQRAAEAALEEAKRRAAEIVARAEQRAKEIDDLTARRAKDIDSDASVALTYAQQRVEELRKQEAEIKGRLRRMLAEHIKALQALEGEAPPPAKSSSRRAPAAPAAPTETEAGGEPAAGNAPKARLGRNGAGVKGNGPGSAVPVPVQGRRSPVVDRMTRDLGEAATSSTRAAPAPDDSFWRR